ncbi:MAG: hypothetical protein H7287_13670 [Thermoleophilia bacterium]|nr:hypothetical protein [Thermoleophilia bacterium]
MTEGSPGNAANEPVATPPGAAAGSSQFPVLRVLAIAGLAAISAQSLGVAIFATPFIPVLVALRLRRDPTPGFVVSATISALIAGAAVSIGRSDPIGLTVAIEAFLLVLVGPISILQARASQPDADDEVAQLDDAAPRFDTQTGEPLHERAWHEPKFLTGFSLSLISRFVPMALCIAILAPAVGTSALQRSMRDGVRGQYAEFTRECRPDGELAGQKDACKLVLEQRDQLLRVVRKHVHLAVGIAAAILALGGAWTSHATTTWRLRASRVPTRPKRPLREFETHWSIAYVTAIGLILVLVLSDVSGDVAQWGRALGIAGVAFGSQLIAGQGAGLLAFTLQGIRGWRRVVLIVCAIFALRYVLVLLLLMGVADLAFHPRRRVSGSFTGRGSVS